MQLIMVIKITEQENEIDAKNIIDTPSQFSRHESHCSLFFCSNKKLFLTVTLYSSCSYFRFCNNNFRRIFESYIIQYFSS